MKQYKWIAFIEAPQKADSKTRIWWVNERRDGGGALGSVRWFGRWRRYAFFPEANTVFEQDCLWDIADFVAERTAEHKESWKKRVTA